MELEIVLHTESGMPLYEQIYRDIRDRIRGGELASGERLPSTRVLAANLQVARSTAELAYEQLEAEGYIEIRPGSGAYVCNIDNIPDIGKNQRGDSAGAPAGHSGAVCGGAAAQERGGEPGQQGPDPAGAGPIDFSPRTIDMSAFPYATWRRILRGILSGDRSELFSRGDPQGDEGLRATIARYLHLARGCVCEPDQIVIGAGNDYLMMLLALVLGEGRRVGMESPTYLRAAQILEAMHETVVPVRSDESGMDVQALERSDCSLVYCMPARQYPMGVSLPWPRRAGLLAWAAKDPDRYLIEDDYDSEFRYRGRPVPSLQSQDHAGRVIYIGTFSKSIAPAIRVSYLVLPRRLLGLFRERAQVFSCTVPRIDQSVLDAFIRDGYYERYLNRMRTRYRARHDLMLELLEPLGGKFRVDGAGAGLHLLLRVRGAQEARGESLRIRNILTEQEYAQRAAAAGVRVYPMSEMYLDGAFPEGQETAPTLLLGYAALTEEEMRKGVELLRGAWEC